MFAVTLFDTITIYNANHKEVKYELQLFCHISSKLDGQKC